MFIYFTLNISYERKEYLLLQYGWLCLGDTSPQPGGSSHLRNQKCHQSAEYASQSSDFSAQKLTEESDAWLVFIQVLTPLGLVMHKMQFNDSFSPINSVFFLENINVCIWWHLWNDMWSWNPYSWKARIQILYFNTLLWHRKKWCDQITILHMPWQLSCHGMCKIETWSDD